MDDFSDIYANTDYHSPHGGSLPGHVQKTKKQRRYERATICLLTALLLSVTIALIIITLTAQDSSSSNFENLLTNLTEQMRNLELEYSTCRSQRDNLATSHTTDTERISKFEQQLDTLRKTIDSSSSSFGNLLTNLTDLTEQMRNLELEYSTCRSQRDNLATSHTTDTERISEFEQQLDTLRKTIEDTCPERWNRLGSKMFFVSTATKDWSSSREDCRQRGADLVIINSTDEQEFLKSQNKSVWIGLTDKTNQIWTWVDDTPITTGYWAPGEPNKARKGEDCVANLVGLNSLNAWTDERCHLKYAWVCEKIVCNDSF